MSRTDRLRDMHERRLQWQPIPRCARCRRILVMLGSGREVPCERCLTVSGELTPDTPAMVTAAFQGAVARIDDLAEETRAIPSIWDARLGDGQVAAHVVSSAARGQRSWSVLRLAPSFGADAEVYALAESAIAEGVRVVLAGIASSVRVSDVRTGRTLVIDGA
jgi:hypothetical protein